MRWLTALAIIALPLLDLAWNLTHLNIGLVDFYGLTAFARGFAEGGAWPATPYFPAGYPLLLSAGGMLGSALIGGYVLSAIGLMLSLWALWRLAREFDLSRGAALAVLFLAWLMPAFRIVAGNPSVDALYTGFGLWFLAAAVHLWRRGAGAQAALTWARLGITLPAILLALLRYHALVLVLPVLLALLVLRRRSWRLAAVGLIAVALAVAFNLGTYHLAYGEFPASVAALQVRTGIEINTPTHYASADALFAGYPAFAAHARTTPITKDYSLGVIAKHTLLNWYKFLRRPAILLAIAGLVLLIIRRCGISGASIIVAWSLCYTLALSVAYYTPRAALLPVLAMLAVAAAAAWHMFTERRRHNVTWVVFLLLLVLGCFVMSQYAMLIARERMHFATASREVEREILDKDWSRSGIVVADQRLLPLRDNPWCEPYTTLQPSWIDDTAIRPRQRAGVRWLPPKQLAGGWPGVSIVLLPVNDTSSEYAPVTTGGYWECAQRVAGFDVYMAHGLIRDASCD